MIVLHHLEYSRSQRILWLLEEIGAPYTIKRYSRDPKTKLAPPELIAVHPLGKSPVITDNGVTVAETGAIVEYLVAQDGAAHLVPAAGSAEKRLYTYWLHFAEGSAMPPVLLKLVFEMASRAVPFLVRPVVKGISLGVGKGFIDPTLRRQMDFIESSLRATGWFAGPHFSAADIVMSFPMEIAEGRGDLKTRPAIRDWLARIQARPAYVAARRKGGPAIDPDF